MELRNLIFFLLGLTLAAAASLATAAESGWTYGLGDCHPSRVEAMRAAHAAMPQLAQSGPFLNSPDPCIEANGRIVCEFYSPGYGGRLLGFYTLSRCDLGA